MKGQAIPYLTFNGNAREAIDFYAKAFEAEVQGIQTFGEADFPTPPEAADRIMHARFGKGDFLIMVSDAFLGQSVETGNHISLALTFENEEEIQRVYDALRQDGMVHMELQDTFWNSKFAKVQDRFGVIWDLDYPKE
ncbi:VOC family protein [Bacillus aerolatus]|uniref:VOC family protein n=1 Tax=Bacillus aerolatus TaxID=2653354 RepID=A0A6I1FFJ9_9BACI|nr:VOC family protein [Bacillus aerolatus]KAB7704298.1 VOC family protein [Bacillus aerolatus]